MPNSRGPHSKHNKGKPLVLPRHPGVIIGYTGDLNDFPTVYFTCGHYTQRHQMDWDVGWDSYVGWECRFFGNVPKGSDESSHDAEKRVLGPVDYVTKLEWLGENRFKGGQAEDLSNWNLDLNLDNDTQKPMRLREFWIRGGGDILKEEDRFAHPSRHHFIPVRLSDASTRMQLWNRLSKTKGATGLVAVGGEWTWR